MSIENGADTPAVSGREFRARTPPHSVEAEQSVLGALLLDNESIDRIGELEAHHFFLATHRTIFVEITRQIVAGHRCDPITLHATLGERAEAAGGLPYFNALAACVPSARTIDRYSAIVRDRWIDRRLIAIADDAISGAHETAPAEAKLAAMQEALSALTQGRAQSEPTLIAETMAAHLSVIEARSQGLDTYYPTGLADLDRLLDGGARPGQVIVIGARPSMGKSTIGLTIARAIAAPRDAPTFALLLSQEMPLAQLNDANIAALGNIPLPLVRRPRPDDREAWARITAGADRASRLNLFLDAQPALRLLDVWSKIASAQRRCKGRLAFVEALADDEMSCYTDDEGGVE